MKYTPDTILAYTALTQTVLELTCPDFEIFLDFAGHIDTFTLRYYPNGYSEEEYKQPMYLTGICGDKMDAGLIFAAQDQLRIAHTEHFQKLNEGREV